MPLLPVNSGSTTDTTKTTTPGKPAGDTSKPGTGTNPGTTTPPTTTPPPTTGVAGNNIDRNALLTLVNGVRAKGCNCGGQQMPPVGPVTWNDLLEKAAYDHSADMNKNNYFDHNSPSGTDPGARLDAVGYKWNTYGENIAKGYMDEQSVITGWINSPGHCKNIMNGNFKEMGIGKSGNYWTMDLGRRMGN
ncbi:CAP domain-containing protein [Chitinophaga qingshengii]|nr:CAP domain-containing protein [Chitinophaga qingshengii]